MTIVDMSHPRIQAYIKALTEYEAYEGTSRGAPARDKVLYAAIVESEMKLTRFEVRAVHEYLAKEGE